MITQKSRGTIVMILRKRKGKPGEWRYGTIYEYGERPPNHPVPSLIGEAFITSDVYRGVAYINDASGDDWLWAYDTWTKSKIL